MNPKGWLYNGSMSKASPSSPSISGPDAHRAVRWMGGLALLMLGYAWLLGHIRLSLSPPWLLAAGTGPQAEAIPYYSLCLFKNLTALPCWFCGLTRSLVLIEQGHWVESMHYHLLGLPVFAVSLVLIPASLLWPQATCQIFRTLSARPVLFTALGVIALCWLWKLAQSRAYW